MKGDGSPAAADPNRNPGVNRSHSWPRAILGYLVLSHPLAVCLVVAATAGFAFVAWRGAPPTSLLARLILAMLGGQLAIGALNDIVDLPDDAVGQQRKPLPSGVISMRGAKAMVVGGLLGMAGFGATLGLIPFAMLLLGTGLGLTYDLWLKRTTWSWLPYLLALPLLPIWVFVALGRFEPRLLFLYPLGALASVGIHFAQSLPDVSADRNAGLTNPTSRLGVRAAFAFAWLAAISAPIFAVIVAWLLNGNASTELVVLVAVSLLLMSINSALLRFDARLGADLCFPLVGLVTLASGLIWTSWASG